MKNRSECLKEYGSDYMIKKQVQAGKLFKVGKALYSDDKHAPELAVLEYQYPQAVLTMHSAFYIHGLTDVIPNDYDFATERNAAKIKNSRVKQYFYPADFFEQGITQVKYKGYPIRIYSKERMLIELLRYKSKLPYDYCYRPPIMSSNRYCILSRRQQFCQGKYTRFWQIHGTTVAQARNAHGKTNAINPSYGYAATKNRKRHRSDSNFGMMPSVFCR